MNGSKKKLCLQMLRGKKHVVMDPGRQYVTRVLVYRTKISIGSPQPNIWIIAYHYHTATLF